MSQIEIYQTKDKQTQVEVRFEGDTVWLTQYQLADLFETDRTSILRHLKNIYKTRELIESQTCAKFAQVQKEGNKTVKRDILHYNLDAIISVGYRVNSLRGTQFRQWVTKRLKDHFIQGYTINVKRLKELQQTIQLISEVAERRDMSGDEAKALLHVVADYAYALDLLDDYDHQRISVRHITAAKAKRIEYEEAKKIILQLRKRFNASSLFGNKKDKSFEGSLNAVFQTFGGTELYPSIEEKAAHLLYFLVKNHPFSDGNKRIAAALFLWFLEKNSMLYSSDKKKRIGDNALVAIILLMAESKPKERESLIRVVINLINKKNR
ncbi:MAG: virulence protein RhuM/Fic/DOC family protein [Bacteroidetes bacterium]|nr:virulence protein RhuM/Fic/DOC family protein [Bacteroidota bacterium]